MSSLKDLRPKAISPVSLSSLVEGWALNTDSSNPDSSAAWSEVQVRGVSMDSSDLVPGELFVAVPGAHHHGAEFAQKAAGLGAVAVVTDAEGAQLVATSAAAADKALNIPVVVVEDPRKIANELAARAYSHPADHLKMIGVTGTNGKTTTAFATFSALHSAGLKPLILSTAEIRVGDISAYPDLTTMQGPVLQRTLALGVELGCRSAVVEVSAHAISLHRVRGMHFDVTAFTNLQHDHLDYFVTMGSYCETKSRLFTSEFTDRAVVCVDDDWGRRVAAAADVPVTTFSAYDPASTADWVVREAVFDKTTVSADVVLAGKDSPSEINLHVPIPGEVNVQNVVAAFLLTHWGLGLPADEVAAGIASFSVPGRMSIVSTRAQGRPLVIVDFAHTAEALDATLRTVREMTFGRLVLVFGTDGDRDASKRPDVGRVGASLADVLWVTDENPRTEDAASIRAQLFEGIRAVRPGLENVREVTTCRRDAIREALRAASVEDTVIITGKGNEHFQEVNGVRHPFQDGIVAEEVLSAVFPL